MHAVQQRSRCWCPFCNTRVSALCNFSFCKVFCSTLSNKILYFSYHASPLVCLFYFRRLGNSWRSGQEVLAGAPKDGRSNVPPDFWVTIQVPPLCTYTLILSRSRGDRCLCNFHNLPWYSRWCFKHTGKKAKQNEERKKERRGQKRGEEENQRW